jgi:hypothetical protein
MSSKTSLTIPYTGKHREKNFTISAESFDVVSKQNWYLTRDGYAITSVKVGNNWKTITLQNYLLQQADGLDVDHINGNKSDYRLENLRVCTRQQNLWNREKPRGVSKYSGVSWRKDVKKWQVKIRSFNKFIHLGYFISENDAGRAYNQKALELRGEYAKLNLIV